MKRACPVAMRRVHNELGVYPSTDEDNNICVKRTRNDGMSVDPEHYALERFTYWCSMYSPTRHHKIELGVDLGATARELVKLGWSRTSVVDALYFLIKE